MASLTPCFQPLVLGFDAEVIGPLVLFTLNDYFVNQTEFYDIEVTSYLFFSVKGSYGRIGFVPCAFIFLSFGLHSCTAGEGEVTSLC